MAFVPEAYQSPRMDCGRLEWYEGDRFTLDLVFALVDQDGEAAPVVETDVAVVSFYDETKERVRVFQFEDIQNQRASLVFDGDVTGNFPKGKYTYDVVLNRSTGRVTLVKDAQVLVR